MVPASNLHLSPIASNCNIPPPSVLRQEARIQQEVQCNKRFFLKSDRQVMEKLSFGGGGPVDFFVNHRVKWPHEYVLSGQNKDRVTYNQLTPLQ